MKATGFITIALLLTAATAQAQFPQAGGFGGMGRGRGEGRGEGARGGERGTPPAPPSRADVERQDPIVVLVSNRAKLALTDSETIHLESLDASLMEQNRPLLAQYDSLLALVPTPSQGGGDAGAADAGPRAELFGVLRGVRSNYREAEKQALALLTSDQRARAAKLLDEQRPQERDFTRRDGGERP